MILFCLKSLFFRIWIICCRFFWLSSIANDSSIKFTWYKWSSVRYPFTICLLIHNNPYAIYGVRFGYACFLSSGEFPYGKLSLKLKKKKKFRTSIPKIIICPMPTDHKLYSFWIFNASFVTPSAKMSCALCVFDLFLGFIVL